ncbi:MAG: RDD family protein [Bacteriovoracales bacterium]|nr:RDD family protein [Bacteriovoracales bacterium]
MDRKYILKSSLNTARLSRTLAKAIDLFLALIITILAYPIGVVLAVAYLGVSDCIQGGQSVGKRFLGFRVISLKDGLPCSLRQSVYRNLPFTIPLFFAIIPFWGGMFCLLLLIPLCALEFYLIFTLDSGHRLGDVIADTTVIGNDPQGAGQEKLRQSWFRDKSKEDGLRLLKSA